MQTVKFSVRLKDELEDCNKHVYLIGDNKELGQWVHSNAVQMIVDEIDKLVPTIISINFVLYSTCIRIRIYDDDHHRYLFRHSNNIIFLRV